VAMILGAMMLVDAPVPEMRIGLGTLLPAVVVMAAGTIALVRMVVAAQRRKATTGAEGMAGRRGTAETELAPEGWVRVQGEMWRAVAEEPLAPGQPVEVVAMDGLRLRVRKGA